MSSGVQTAGGAPKQSRIGKRPVPVPKGVTVNISDMMRVDVQGPKGKLSQQLPGDIRISREGDVLTVQSSARGRDALRLQGLGRALLASMVKGAAEGYERTLELVGTGYRAEVKGRTVTLQLGLSHPSSYELPDGVSAVVPGDTKGTVLVLSSADKAVLRPPEPYGGKGIRYRGEQIRRKAGKAGKGRK